MFTNTTKGTKRTIEFNDFKPNKIPKSKRAKTRPTDSLQT